MARLASEDAAIVEPVRRQDNFWSASNRARAFSPGLLNAGPCTRESQIRTNNITGERGEQLAISYYNKTLGLPKLQAAPKGTQNIDAISKKGERYTIKTLMLPNKTTGVFYGMGTPDKPITEKVFEYLIIVVINEYYELD